MKTFKTKLPINFPFGRQIINATLFYQIEKISFDINNIILERGYYFYYDENQNPIIVSETKGTVILRSEFELLENEYLPILTDNYNAISNIEQRIEQMFYLQIDADNQKGLSFGTVSEDWEFIN